MLIHCISSEKKITFRDTNTDKESNIYTILVGKNGSGKSQLLRAIVHTLVDKDELGPANYRDFPIEQKKIQELSISSKPSIVIASSTSPFDKFPTSRTNNKPGYYRYLGLKGLSSMNLGSGFMSRTIAALTGSLINKPEKLTTTKRAFEYLNYHFYLRCRLVLEIPIGTIRTILDSDNPSRDLISAMRDRYGVIGYTRSRRFDLTEETTELILPAFMDFIQNNRKPRIDLTISDKGIYDGDKPIDESALTLLQNGLFGARDIYLLKKGNPIPFQIRDASSGEQSVLLSLLGISSCICDGALILIDEPEICLHPEWQEKYITLLTELFQNFKKCHFIIATHSPQIVSRVGSNNCYILDIQTGETINATSLNKRSADFQLANVFGAPGFKNEYLSREIIGILTALANREKISPKKLLTANNIIKLLPAIDINDPNFKLITMLADAIKEEY